DESECYESDKDAVVETNQAETEENSAALGQFLLGCMNSGPNCEEKGEARTCEHHEVWEVVQEFHEETVQRGRDLASVIPSTLSALSPSSNQGRARRPPGGGARQGGTLRTSDTSQFQ